MHIRTWLHLCEINSCSQDPYHLTWLALTNLAMDVRNHNQLKNSNPYQNVFIFPAMKLDMYTVHTHSTSTILGPKMA